MTRNGERGVVLEQLAQALGISCAGRLEDVELRALGEQRVGVGAASFVQRLQDRGNAGVRSLAHS